jgi:ferredoxin
MLDSVVAACDRSGRRAQLHLERFGPGGPSAAPRPAGTAFEVELARTGTVLAVGPGQSILDVVRQVVPDHPFSCREGDCGTCETAVLGGVPEHRDSILTDEEKAANDTMMICVGRSLTPRLVLDL